MAYRYAYLELFRVIGKKLELTNGQRGQLLQFLADLETWNSGTDAVDALVVDHTDLTTIGVNTHAQIDTHIATSSTHFTEASIDHTAIQNIGTNTHAQVDTHLAHNTGHPSVVVSASEPADSTIDTEEGCFWYSA